MAQFDSVQFEALWQGAQSKTVSRKVAAVQTKADLSLTGMLNQYMVMAASYRDQGKINIIDYNELVIAVNGLKTILARINDAGMAAEAMTQAVEKMI